jgi:mono/diheme cytochrome c family protein
VNSSLRRGDRRSAIALLGMLLACGCVPDDDQVADPTPVLNANTQGSALNLPLAGTQIPPLPPGEGRDVAQTHCLACHASEMLLQQQLTETQWRAEVDKMHRWGANVPDEDKDLLVQYLVSRFGPDNDRFTPIAVSPHQRPDAGPNGGAQ